MSIKIAQWRPEYETGKRIPFFDRLADSSHQR